VAIIDPSKLKYPDIMNDRYDDFDRYNAMMQRKEKYMGIGEAKEATATKNDVNHFRVNAIENGYIVSYSAPSIAERQRFAATLTEVGEQIVAAAVEMKLRGSEAK
jgi:hypothetical protein